MNTDELIRALRPDDLLDETYHRRREADLARIFADLPAHRPLSVRARLVLVGAAAAGFAALVVPALVAGVAMPDRASAPGGGEVASASPSRPAPVATLDARSFLLAGADNAARADVRTGRFWYSRHRTYEPRPSGEILVSSTESWYDAATGRGRMTTGLDAEVVAGEAARTAKPTPTTQDYRMKLLLNIGGEDLSQDDFWRLPRDVEGLRRWLHAHRRGESSVDFTFWMTRLMLSSPTTPATRAAMLRILADQPGLKLEQGVTDPAGRPGAAVVSPDGTYRLIVDESGARLLAEEYNGPDREEKRAGRSVYAGARKGEKTVYESSGWVEKIGDRP
ncbi:CU044_5270 family protein [Microbispora sp. NPDC046933]|uniref:CU044_5270 family protein n=1 Tax=Microbispora sp. NPDC046933 TaxID=3155618 RepID=UPI0033DAEC87